MILASGGELDWGVIAVIGVPIVLAIVGLIVVATKAQIHKTVSPIRDNQTKMDNEMETLEKRATSTETVIKEMKRHISDSKTLHAVTDEKLNTIISTMNEIKDYIFK